MLVHLIVIIDATDTVRSHFLKMLCGFGLVLAAVVVESASSGVVGKSSTVVFSSCEVGLVMSVVVFWAMVVVVD